MKRFLIADDSNFMRATMNKLLTSNGYTVVGEAENGRIAVEMYKHLKPDFVTMDITMNEMTGIEALEEILKFDPNAKIIMVSAMGQKPFVEEAMRLGAKGFLVKPYNAEIVTKTIEKLSN